MYLKIEIESDNADTDMISMAKKVLRKMQDGNERGFVRDINGNVVGSFSVEFAEESDDSDDTEDSEENED